MKLVFFLLPIALLSGCGGGVSSDSNSPPIEPVATSSSDAELQKQIAEIAKEAKGKVGVYATAIETGQHVFVNPNEKFAMQSVVKLPISMAVLRIVDRGHLLLGQEVLVKGEDFVPSNMRSPMRELFDKDPSHNHWTVRALIELAISQSDGTASDVLQRLAGNAEGVQAYLDSIGISGMHIERTHKEFGREWNRQYENWATPAGVIEMLTKLFTGDGISEQHRELLLKDMTESYNPPNRLKGMLSPGTVVAHKTGTGGTQNGITSATNDVGIITLPNGSHVAIAVFVGDSTADLATREAVIAKIARAVFEKWSQASTQPVKSANFNERHTLN